MKLILIRHGEYKMNDPSQGLSETGIQDVKKMAFKLKNEAIDLIISSPKTRAVQTSEILASVIGYPKEKLFQISELKPSSSPEDTLKALKPYKAFKTIALVGHLPSLELIVLDVENKQINFNTSDVHSLII